MAEMEIAGRGKRAAGVRGKKLSTKIDLTPMVDLGFLLIAFFMTTTTLAKPRRMEINMPYKDEHALTPSLVKASTALTVLPGKDHRIYYYEGLPEGQIEVNVAYLTGNKSIRQVMINKKALVAQLKRTGMLQPKDELTVLIKPGAASTYSDLVSILDEMNINAVTTYAIVDLSIQEQEAVAAKDAAIR